MSRIFGTELVVAIIHRVNLGCVPDDYFKLYEFMTGDSECRKAVYDEYDIYRIKKWCRPYLVEQHSEIASTNLIACGQGSSKRKDVYSLCDMDSAATALAYQEKFGNWCGVSNTLSRKDYIKELKAEVAELERKIAKLSKLE